MEKESKLDLKAIKANSNIVAKKYWQNRMNDFELNTYFETTEGTYASGTTLKKYIFKAPQLVFEKLDSLAKSNKAKHIVLLSTLGILANKFSSYSDIGILSPVYGNGENSGDRLVLTRMTDFSNLSFLAFLGQFKSDLMNDLKHGGFPLEKILTTEKTTINQLSFTGILLEELHNSTAFDELSPDLLFSFGTKGSLTLRLSYRSSRFQNQYIERLTSYYFKLLNNLLTDRENEIGKINFITEEEKEQLLHSFNNPPSIRSKKETILDFFEQQVQSKKDKIAITFEEDQLTYGELDNRSNQLAAYLVKQGVKKEELIPLYVKRSPDMLIGMLGILKAGAAYVPIDPDCPEQRLHFMLKETMAKWVVSHSMFDDKLKNNKLFSPIYLDTSSAVFSTKESNSAKIKIDPSQLAYVIYTSGTTGTPKGILIEHGSLIDYSKTFKNYFQLTEDDKVIQQASLAFDTAVEEIFPALISGASIIIMRQGGLDIFAIIKAIKEKGASVLSTTPLILNELNNHAEELENLRIIISGGDLLKPIHIDKLLDKHPIYNTYGPSESTVCITYNKIEHLEHSSCIGKPITNRTVYIINKNENLCPVFVAGELVVSGAGLARGYFNNDQLTTEKFVTNPFDPGQRMYKTGDLARWLPNGNVEFLGRIDKQVKIRGIRIEPGEIEGQLISHKLIQEVAVAIKEREGSKFLVAYFISNSELDASELTAFLSDKLPDYMLPTYFVRLNKMPLTVNGKLDKKNLPTPDIELKDFVAPVSAEERLMTSVWSKALGIEKLGITDNFFTIGGDSIKSIQISSRLRTMGYKISVRDILIYQNIKELSKRMEPIVRELDQSTVTGNVVLAPIQHWFFQESFKHKEHYNQSVMLNFANGISQEVVVRIFQKIQNHHDALRMVFKEHEDKIIQTNKGTDLPVWIEEKDFREEKNPKDALLQACDKLQPSFDLEEGPLMKLGLFHLNDGSRLLIVIHHLVVDGISWRILFEDIEQLYQQIQNEENLFLSLKTISFQSWTEHLQDYIKTDSFSKAKKYWDSKIECQVMRPQRDKPNGINIVGENTSESIVLSHQETKKLLTEVSSAFNTRINDILLCAFLLGIHKQFQEKTVAIDMEGHGREELIEGIDIGRTIGWFTSVYPVILEMENASDLGSLIKTVKESLRKVPNNGIDYLLNRYFNSPAKIENEDAWVSFNYLGQFDSDTADNSFEMAPEPTGQGMSSVETRSYDWDINGMIADNQLSISLSYCKSQYEEKTIGSFMNFFQESLKELITYCSEKKMTSLTPSDLSYKNLSITQLDKLQENYEIEDIYPLSPMQEGMLFHSLLDADSDNYLEQMSFRRRGPLNLDAAKESMNKLMSRYAILRSLFLSEGFKRPLQLVLKERAIDFSFKDVRKDCINSSKEAVLESFKLKDRQIKFELSKDVLMRVTILQTDEKEFEFVWTHHHILMDGWCISIVVNEFSAFYSQLTSEKTFDLPEVHHYSNYINWLEGTDKQASIKYWKDYLSGYNSLASVPEKVVSLTEDLSYKFACQKLMLTEDQTKKLHQASMKYGVTLNTILQVAWGVLLSKYNNVKDVVFGSVVSGRPAELEGIETMIGLFINTIPVRIKYEDDSSFKDLLEKTQDNAIESDPFHYHPLAEIQSSSKLGRNLMNHVMVFENYPVTKVVEGTDEKETTVDNVQLFAQTNYDFFITIVPDSKIEVVLDFNENLYDKGFIGIVLKQFNHIINEITSDNLLPISEIGLLTEEEIHELLHEFNASEFEDTDTDGITFLDLFESAVQEFPNNIAVEYREVTMSYQELDKLSNQIAHFLISEGLVKEQLVPLVVDRSIQQLIFILGIHKAGGAFLSVDPRNPSGRIKKILEDCDPKIILLDNKYYDLVLDIKNNGKNMSHAKLIDSTVIKSKELTTLSTLKPDVKRSTNDLAYVVYTSGSTGLPKGVMLHDGGMANHFIGLRAFLELSETDCFAQSAECSFDVYVVQFLQSLISGGCTKIVDRDDILDPENLMQLLETSRITTIELVPSIIKSLLEVEKSKNLNLRWLISTGEAITTDLAMDWYKKYPDIPIVNAYGPAETSDDVTAFIIPNDLSRKSMPVIPIGKPLPNLNLYVLNENLQLCSKGVKGEIAISGPGVGKGYWNDKKGTEEKFIKNPFVKLLNKANHEILYRTGDIGCWQEDGNILCFGRSDSMVKIRGARIETREVEEVLVSLNEIEEVVVLARGEEENKYLIAYYISEKKQDKSVLRNFLSQNIPDFMVPSHYIQIEKMPLTLNGKLDKNALPEPEPIANEGYVAPTSETEKKLVEIWAEILSIDESLVSVEKSFFELGGNSLTIVRLNSLINKNLDWKITITEMFQYTTIQDLIAFVSNNSNKMENYSKEVEEEVSGMHDVIDLFN